MFKKSLEQKIIKEADKIASKKESLDALSWNRVIKISKRLQKNIDEKERQELARELLAIARANTSLIGKLGVDLPQASRQLMPSGIEVPEGEDSSPRALPQDQSSKVSLVANDCVQEVGSQTLPSEVQSFGEATPADVSPPFSDVLVPADKPVGDTPTDAQSLGISSPEAESAPVRSIVFPVEEATAVMPEVSEDASQFFSAPEVTSDIFIPRKSSSSEGEAKQDSLQEELPQEKEQSIQEFKENIPHEEKQEGTNEGKGEEGSSEQVSRKKQKRISRRMKRKKDKHPSCSEEEFAPCAQDAKESQEPLVQNSPEVAPEETLGEPKKESPDAHTGESKNESTDEPAEKQDKKAQRKGKNLSKKDMADFKQIYESRDGGLCFFQDSEGHIVSVDSSRLA